MIKINNCINNYSILPDPCNHLFPKVVTRIRGVAALPSGLGGPRPSGDSEAPPPGSAGCSGCRDTGVTVEEEPIREEEDEGVLLPGVSFTVVFSGYDVLKQLSTCNPDDTQLTSTHTFIGHTPGEHLTP